jgi:hypothetical protein
MNKYRSLEALLKRLSPSIRARHLAVAPYWRNDEQAIGFYKPEEPELATYIFTHGQPPGTYGIQLTYPDLDDNDVGNVPLFCENIRLERLLDLVAMHFGLDDVKRSSAKNKR